MKWHIVVNIPQHKTYTVVQKKPGFPFFKTESVLGSDTMAAQEAAFWEHCLILCPSWPHQGIFSFPGNALP